MVNRSRALRPAEFARGLGDRQVVDAGIAQAHQPLVIKLPILVTIGAQPVAGIVVPFIGEAHGDAIVGKSPQLLDQSIVELARPFAAQERLDLGAPHREFGAIAPAAVLGIAERDALGVARVPGILGHAHLLHGGLACERRKRGTAHALMLLVVAYACPIAIVRFRLERGSASSSPGKAARNTRNGFEDRSPRHMTRLPCNSITARSARALDSAGA